MANFDADDVFAAQLNTNNEGGYSDPSSLYANENWTGNIGVAEGLNSSSYQSSTTGFDTSSDFVGGGSVYGAQSGVDNSYAVAASSNELVQVGGAALQVGNVQQSSQYASQGGIFNDPNPQVIRRAALGGALTYTQNIKIRFLQPPPVPPPGPLIIKEVRPPQPPPPPPLRLRQTARPLPQLPPLVLRERPPVPPASVASQTVVRRLAAIPVPPRTVVLERLPPLPAKPRDIIIERWVPYGAQAKRRTIVQRAAAAQGYASPRNVIIFYEPVQVRVMRQFQRFAVTQENPQAYVARYGASLLESTALIQQARSAGVVEDISTPAGGASTAQFSASSASLAVDDAYGYSNSATSQEFASTEDSDDFEGLEIIGGAEAGTYGLRVASDHVAGNYSSQSVEDDEEDEESGAYA